MEGWDELMRSIADRQHSLLGQRQLRDVELTSVHWWRAVRSGRWRLRTSKVLQLVGAAETPEMEAMAAVLHAGPEAQLHGRSSLALFGFHAFSFREVEVAVPWGSKRRMGPGPATVHYLRDLRACDSTVYRSVPTQTALRAIWSVAAEYAAPHRVERGKLFVRRLIDNAVKLDLMSYEGLHLSVEELHDRGRNGTLIMRWCRDERPIGSNPLESRNEERLEEILRSGGRRPLVRQAVVGGEHLIGRTDHRDATRPLVVEVNSLLHHSLPSDRAADEVRYADLNEAGFMVGVVWDADLWTNPHDVRRTVDRARQLADAGERSVLHSPSCPWPGSVTVNDRP